MRSSVFIFDFFTTPTPMKRIDPMIIYTQFDANQTKTVEVVVFLVKLLHTTTNDDDGLNIRNNELLQIHVFSIFKSNNNFQTL